MLFPLTMLVHELVFVPVIDTACFVHVVVAIVVVVAAVVAMLSFVRYEQSTEFSVTISPL